jgi:ribonuclease HI
MCPVVAEGPRVVAAASDGACSGNPGPGGWGALLRFEDGSVREMGGFDPSTTNNRMELTAALAVLEALRELPLHPDLTLRTDSRYLIDGLGKWLPGWKRKGWRTASGGPVLNRDLWEALDQARLAAVPLEHVRGHSGDPDNERCDAIAVAFSKGEFPRLAGSRQAEPQASGNGSRLVDDPAPASLVGLLGRLELAERLAAGGFGLSLAELSELVEMPVARLEQRQKAWRWRDWQVRPSGEGEWRLERAVEAAPRSR